MENDIKKRIYNCLNPYSETMMEFLRLVSIEYSNETLTACVTCESRPKLLLNKDFIDEYCTTDEHLFMLIMHEMSHILLGHTKLFKRASKIDNIVFDAVINAMLVRSFDSEAYTSFFTTINSSKSFPSCLLRPKDKDTPKEYVPYLNSLYKDNKGTYAELYELLINEFKQKNLINYILLGNHDENEYDKSFDDLYKKIVNSWPREEIAEGRNIFGEEVVAPFKKEEVFNKRKKEFYRFIKKEGLKGKKYESKGFGLNVVDIESFVPNLKDRTIYAKKEFYDLALYKSVGRIYKKDTMNSMSYIYIDVSGSVLSFISSMLSLLEEPVKKKMCELYSFSTVVHPLSISDFKNKKYKTTYGTDINACFKHFFSEKRNVKKIIIITDGYTGKTKNEYVEKIKNLEIDCVLFGDNTTDTDLKNIVKEFYLIN